jgi:predicted membrane channel-forming protein YqfA (hemolysin III family)
MLVTLNISKKLMNRNLSAIIFLVMGILLIMAFTFNLSVVDELQQAANFDNWKMFILFSGIVALLASGVFAFGSWIEFQLYSGSHNSVVPETIYILGVGMELERPACAGKETPATLVEMSRLSSMASIFGFGYDDSFKWTFAGTFA